MEGRPLLFNLEAKWPKQGEEEHELLILTLLEILAMWLGYILLLSEACRVAWLSQN